MTEVAFTLKQWRSIREMTQDEVAEKLNISTETLRKWEKDIRNIPLRHLLALCKLYDIKLDQVKIEPAP